jgi:hypothetical protein
LQVFNEDLICERGEFLRVLEVVRSGEDAFVFAEFEYAFEETALDLILNEGFVGLLSVEVGDFLSKFENVFGLAFGLFVIEELGFDLFEIVEDFVEVL